MQVLLLAELKGQVAFESVLARRVVQSCSFSLSTFDTRLQLLRSQCCAKKLQFYQLSSMLIASDSTAVHSIDGINKQCSSSSWAGRQAKEKKPGSGRGTLGAT